MIDTVFLDELSSKAPTPGGGGASAYCGALAAALGAMVGDLTEGKKSFVAINDQVLESIARLEASRAKLTALIGADAEVFKPLAACYSMPKDTDEEKKAREEALQAALVPACQVPLDIMQNVMDVLHEDDFLAHNGTRLGVSDAGVCAVFAKAALQGASFNVFINTKAMTDTSKAQSLNEACEAMLASGCALADEIYTYVLEQVR